MFLDGSDCREFELNVEMMKKDKNELNEISKVPGSIIVKLKKHAGSFGLTLLT